MRRERPDVRFGSTSRPDGKIRVVYVSHSAGLSGSERALLRLLETLDRSVIDPVVFLPQEGPLLSKLNEAAIPSRIRPSGWWIPATNWSAEAFLSQLEGLPDRSAALTREVESLHPDLVHTNTLVSLEGAVAAARLRLPHVWHSRGLFGSGFPPAYLDDVPFFYGLIDRLTDLLVCVSKAVEEEACRYGTRSEKAVVPDGLDASALRTQPVESRQALLARLGLEPSDRLIVALGGIQRRKGQKDLVEAAALLEADFPELVVVLAGHASDPLYATEIEDLIRARRLQRRVRLVGFQDEIHSLLAHAEVFVHPSLSEGFALVVLEAMAAGTPVVATRSGGPEEIIEDGRSGLLVEPASPADLAEAIRRVLSESALSARLRGEGPERAAQFSAAASAGRITKLYRALRERGRNVPSDRARTAGEACDTVLARARLAAGRVAS